MKTRATIMLAGMFALATAATAQPACDYDIDTDGDLVPEGTLYRDLVYFSFSDLIVYSDFLGSNGAITYSRDVELYDGTTTDLKMDVYYPNPGTDTLAARDKPVIFFFYGGGFVNGTSIRVKDLCLQYTQRGYTCVAPNYRLGFHGADESDSIHLCEDLIGPAVAAYRALLDAQAAIRWMKDSCETLLGFDIDTSNFFVHGPSFFPMLSHMQDEEVPNFLKDQIGHLDNSLKLKATVGRSAAINLLDFFVGPEDTTPFLIFHGSCDKSVPFFKWTAYKRFACDSIIDPSLVNDYTIYGSYLIIQQVNHYYEYYPICGLHHSLKDAEDGFMLEPVAEFFYNMVCDNILPTDPPRWFPYFTAECDISDKCKARDNYDFCDTAEVLPPFGGGSCDGLPRLTIPAGVRVSNMGAHPNPTTGEFVLSYVSEAEGTVRVEVYDLMGRRRMAAEPAVVPGLNALELALPTDAEAGVYVVAVNGKAGPRIVLE